MVVLGIALCVETAFAGGGIGYLLGALLVVAGCGPAVRFVPRK